MIVNPIAASYLFIRYILFLFLIFVMSLPVLAAERSIHVTNKAIQALQLKVAGNVTVFRAQKSPYVSFFKADPNAPLSDLSVSSPRPEDRATNFIQTYKDAFTGLNSPLEIVATHVRNHQAKNQMQNISTVRMQQLFKGVIVRGAEVVVQMNESGIMAANSKLNSDLDGIDINPAISELAAETAARRVIFDLYGVKDVNFSAPQLEIFDPGILSSSPKSKSPKLTWFIEATNSHIHEYIWIDANSGQLIKHFSQIARLHIDRNVRDAAALGDTCDFSAAPEVRVDPAPATGNLEVDAAYDLSGAAYDYYLNTLDRHGIKNIIDTDSSVLSIVNVCNGQSLSQVFNQPTDVTVPITLTIENAALVQTQMLYASGYVVDDIVGHEYTHRIINEPGSGQFLLVGESGALAESFADILGEAIDLSTVTENDLPADKWSIGEDAPEAKPFRHLLSPGDNTLNEGNVAYPEKVTDPNFYCGIEESVYIHKNSSVLSHAFALTVEGISFNGFTISPVALDKVAKVYYDSLALLTSASRFIDAYDAIIRTATTAVSSGEILSSDQTSIVNALNAVEMNVTPCVVAQIPYCPTGLSPEFVFRDGFEDISSGNWASSTLAVGVDHWNSGSGLSPGDVYHSGTDPFATLPIPRQGIYALYADGSRRMGASAVSMTDVVAIGKDYRIQFEHNYAFENLEADGGLIEYSVNEGEWSDAGPLIVSGVTYTPDKVISGLFGNPLGGRAGFLNFMLENDAATLPVYDYASTQLDLNLIPETPVSIKFRFVVGTDPSTDARGWVIDDFTIYTCESQVFRINQGPIALTTNESGVDIALFDVTLESAPTGNVTINLSSSLSTEGVVTVPASQSLLFTPLNWNSPQTVTVMGQDDVVVDGDIPYVVRLTGVAVDPLDDKFNGTVDVAITNIDDDVPATASEGGGGGCSLSLATKNKFDPILPLLVLLSIVYLLVRRKTVILTA